MLMREPDADERTGCHCETGVLLRKLEAGARK